MSAPNQDIELLRTYQQGSQEAFARLVRLHSGWIYAAALRRTRDEHLAEDVTQATFIVLVRQASKLQASIPLAPWLFRVMSYAASTALRSEGRRRQWERKAAMNHPKEQSIDAEWGLVSADLDELLMRLTPSDRDAIVLRFYQGKSFREMGDVLGVGEDAARKRVDRAVERLRQRFNGRGVTVAGGALATMLAANAAAAPTSAALAAGTAALTATNANAAALAQQAAWALAAVKLKLAAAVIAVLVLSVAAISLVPRATNSASATAPVSASVPARIAPVRVTDPALGGPGMMPPWPLALPGSITGAPAIADLEGNGRLCVIVPCEALSDATLLHPTPDQAARVFAFRLDGTLVRGWPVEIVDPRRRQQREDTGRYSELWSSSPTIARGADGRTRVVLSTPYFLGLRVISPDGRVRELGGGSQWANIPVTDINGDGVSDIITGAGLWTVEGGPIPGWPATHPVARISGFAPCIGDANGDGKPEVYHLMLRDGDMGARQATVIGYDAAGNELAGWPRVVETAQPISHATVMGDVSGDSKLEVIGNFGAVYAWTWDGKPAPGTHDGILVSDASAGDASPALADLDGDGKAEIIVFDSRSGSIRAWHGDGRPVAGADGVLATLPPSSGGVSVVDLAGDGTWDFFAGTHWLKFNPKTGERTIINMLSQPAETDSVQPSVADVDGDGNAEVIFGLRDGRVCVYRTMLEYQSQHAPWPTANGNFQRTGVLNTSRP